MRIVEAAAGTLSIASPSQFGPGPLRYTPDGAAGAVDAVVMDVVTATDNAAALVGGGAGQTAPPGPAALAESGTRLKSPAMSPRPIVVNVLL
jgi:hypothetical protein